MLSAAALLKQNSGEKEKLSVTAIGDVRAAAGNIVLVDIEPEGCRVLRGKPRLLL